MINTENIIDKQKIIPMIDLSFIDVFGYDFYLHIIKKLYDVDMHCIMFNHLYKIDSVVTLFSLLKNKFSDIIIGIQNVISISYIQNFFKDQNIDFITMPICNEDLYYYCFQNCIECFPGGCTPTEIVHCEKSLLSEKINFFPAESFGGLQTIENISHLDDLYIEFIVDGGINLKNLKSYLCCLNVYACIYDFFYADFFPQKKMFTKDLTSYDYIFNELSRIKNEVIQYYNDFWNT